jgi:hypothetical protein
MGQKVHSYVISIVDIFRFDNLNANLLLDIQPARTVGKSLLRVLVFLKV